MEGCEKGGGWWETVWLAPWLIGAVPSRLCVCVCARVCACLLICLYSIVYMHTYAGMCTCIHMHIRMCL